MIGRALVTGGAGFIGSHLVDRLVDEGAEVLVIDDLSTGRLERLADSRRTGRLQIHQMDIRARELADAAIRFRPEVLFHLGAQTDVRTSVHDAVHDASVNVVGTVNVLEAARQAGAARIVFASSGGAVYGEAKKLPTPERTARRPESPYGVSKKIVDDYFKYFHEAYGLGFVLLALANVYGPRQDPLGEAGVVAIWTKAMLDGRRPVIFGDGSQTRDFVFVKDVVDAFIRAAQRGAGKFFNIGSGAETSVNELFERLASIVGYRGRPEYLPARPGEVLRSCLAVGAAEKHLGWSSFTEIGDGLRQTVAFMREH